MTILASCDCEVATVLKKIAIVISSMLVGVCCGSDVGWLAQDFFDVGA